MVYFVGLMTITPSFGPTESHLLSISSKSSFNKVSIIGTVDRDGGRIIYYSPYLAPR